MPKHKKATDRRSGPAVSYNHLREWLEPQIDERGWGIEEFANRCALTRTAMYYFFSGKNTPTEQTMARMCRVLGKPLSEGLAQYTPKPKGRPKGTQTQVLKSARVPHLQR